MFLSVDGIPYEQRVESYPILRRCSLHPRVSSFSPEIGDNRETLDRRYIRDRFLVATKIREQIVVRTGVFYRLEAVPGVKRFR